MTADSVHSQQLAGVTVVRLDQIQVKSADPAAAAHKVLAGHHTFRGKAIRDSITVQMGPEADRVGQQHQARRVLELPTLLQRAHQ